MIKTEMKCWWLSHTGARRVYIYLYGSTLWSMKTAKWRRHFGATSFRLVLYIYIPSALYNKWYGLFGEVGCYSNGSMFALDHHMTSCSILASISHHRRVQSEPLYIYIYFGLETTLMETNEPCNCHPFITLIIPDPLVLHPAQ